MKKKIVKMLSFIIIFALMMTLSAIASEVTYTSTEDLLQSLADSIIVKKDNSLARARSLTLSDEVQYDNIEEFVETAQQHEKISDLELAKFILEYLEIYSEDTSLIEFPEDKILNALNYKNVTQTTSYFNVPEKGEPEQISRQELDESLSEQKASRIYEVSKPVIFEDPDGKMGFSMYSIDTGTYRSGDKLIEIMAGHYWFEAPIFEFDDVFAVNTTGVFDDSFDEWARHGAVGECVHGCGLLKTYGYADENGYSAPGATYPKACKDMSLDYFSLSGLAVRFPVSILHGHHNHRKNFWLTSYQTETLLSFRIAVKKGVSAAQAWYSHKIIGFGGISIEVSSGGPGIGFSVNGTKQDFHTPVLSIDYR